jgi:hypothetical protein
MNTNASQATVLMIVGGSGLILAVLATLASVVAFGTPTGWLVSTALTVVGFDVCSCAMLIAIRSGGMSAYLNFVEN